MEYPLKFLGKSLNTYSHLFPVFKTIEIVFLLSLLVKDISADLCSDKGTFSSQSFFTVISIVSALVIFP